MFSGLIETMAEAIKGFPIWTRRKGEMKKVSSPADPWTAPTLYGNTSTACR